MKTQKHKRSLRRKSQRSFTLVEVVVAIGLMAYLIIEVVTVQGNSVFFSQYGRNATQATWLAQRVMSNVEYNWNSKPFLDMKTKISEHTFEKYPEYKWSLEIKEWDFPFVKVLTGGLMGGGEDGEEEENPMSKIIESVTDQVFGDEPIFMTAYVEVSWSEGAARDSTSLTYLLTNNSKLDDAIIALKPTWDKLTAPPKKKKGDKKKKKKKKKKSEQPKETGELDPGSGFGDPTSGEDYDQ